MKILDELEKTVEALGFKAGTPEFGRALRAQRVTKCKEMRGMESCWNCPSFDHCGLIKTHLRDLYDVKGLTRKDDDITEIEVD